MSYFETLIIAFGLAMDAFAASISKGICIKQISKKQSLVIAIFFGGFQFLMPFIGYYLGISMIDIISRFDYIVSFLLLNFIGLKMILESLNNRESEIECCKINQFSLKDILVLAIVTSLDALAVGVTFSLTDNNLFSSTLTIGIVTFILSYIGVYIGRSFGNKYEKKAEVLGGVVLMLIGFKMLISHYI